MCRASAEQAAKMHILTGQSNQVLPSILNVQREAARDSEYLYLFWGTKAMITHLMHRTGCLTGNNHAPFILYSAQMLCW